VVGSRPERFDIVGAEKVLTITGRGRDVNASGGAAQDVALEEGFRGQTVRFRACARTSDVTGAARIWIVVYAKNGVERARKGSTEIRGSNTRWLEVEAATDWFSDKVRIAALLEGGGIVRLTDLALESKSSPADAAAPKPNLGFAETETGCR
jgi:hypothetical protein